MPRGTIDTPPADLRRLIPKLTPLIEELARLRAEAAVAVAAVDEAKRALQDAEQADRQAAADFARRLRRQKPKPAAVKARAALAQAETAAAALLQAVSDAQNDLESAIEEHREEYTTKLDHESEQGRERSRKAAAKLAELEAARSKVLALRRWLDDGRYAPGKSRSPSVDLRRRSGEAYTVGDLLPLIESALAPPVARPKPEPQPLRRVTV
jgi:chromosome segregation ATPase